MRHPVLLGSLLFLLVNPSICFSNEASDSVWKNYELGNFEEALNGARLLASKGNHWAENMIGLSYESGRAVSQDYEEAFRWYQKSASGGDSYGQYNLGRMYESGKGVIEDRGKAAKWYMAAAKTGHPTDPRNLAEIYLSDEGLLVKKQAVVWLEVAFDRGDVRSAVRLGKLFETERQYGKARKWYRAAADNGNLDGQRELASLLITNQGGPQNLVLAYMWLTLGDHRGLENQIERLRAKLSSFELDAAEKASPRQWNFAEDMNKDGKATISDLPEWFSWLFYYPGDLFIDYLLYEESPKKRDFFEITPGSYRGRLSLLISFVAWLCGISLLIAISIPIFIVIADFSDRMEARSAKKSREPIESSLSYRLGQRLGKWVRHKHT
jgi:TPR repeat protein